MDNEKLNVALCDDPKSPVAEAYRAIRTNIRFTGVDKPPVQTILITSALPDEGKSTIAVNLAVVLAKAGNKVLVVDGDMRNPTIHKLLNVEKDGLSNFICQDELPYTDFVKHLEGQEVDYLTAGPVPPNPSELLLSRRFVDTLTQMKEDYDFILIDTPPVIPVADAAGLSHYVDGVILVIESDKNPPRILIDAKKRLVQAGANILGAVLNKVKVEHNKRYGYGYGKGYGYGYYYAYGGDEEKN